MPASIAAPSGVIGDRRGALVSGARIAPARRRRVARPMRDSKATEVRVTAGYLAYAWMAGLNVGWTTSCSCGEDELAVLGDPHAVKTAGMLDQDLARRS